MSPRIRYVVWLLLAALGLGALNSAGAVSGPLRLTGSFMQYQDEMQTWDATVWVEVLDRMKELEMNTIIVQMLAYENPDGTTHSFIGPEGQPDATEVILNYADTNDFKVFLGLFMPQGAPSVGDTNFLPQLLTKNVAVARQTWQRYFQALSHPCFAGWYIPLETWTGDYESIEVAQLRSFFGSLRQACRALSGDLPVAISPFISSDRPPPCRVEEVYRLLLIPTVVDLVLLQDSVGAQGWTTEIGEHVSPYFEAFQKACQGTGVRLWANLESYEISGADFTSCDATRLERQFEATAPYVDEFVTFDFLNYMNPIAFISSWDSARRDRMQQLFSDYKALFVTAPFEPLGPPGLSALAATNRLILSWQSLTGDVFQVQYKATLEEPSWTPLTVEIQTNGSQFSAALDNPGGSARGFFRLLRSPRLQPLDSMVWVPPGTFLMGTPTNDPNASPAELPQFEVTHTRGFWISRFETSQSEYQNLMCANPSAFPDDLENPVESVSWTEALDYCGKLTLQERQAGRLPEGYSYRLPTEAEWEYAARAGTTTPFSFGADVSELQQYAWFEANSPYGTHPVGQLLINSWGLFDTAGNVAEWCWDWIGGAPTGTVVDLQGATNGVYRAVRGGAWSSPASACRCSWRRACLPTQTESDLGFRVVLVSPSP